MADIEFWSVSEDSQRPVKKGDGVIAIGIVVTVAAGLKNAMRGVEVEFELAPRRRALRHGVDVIYHSKCALVIRS
jgi:hypothetical protein